MYNNTHCNTLTQSSISCSFDVFQLLLNPITIVLGRSLPKPDNWREEQNQNYTWLCVQTSVLPTITVNYVCYHYSQAILHYLNTNNLYHGICRVSFYVEKRHLNPPLPLSSSLGCQQVHYANPVCHPQSASNSTFAPLKYFLNEGLIYMYIVILQDNNY